ncbi:MAG: EpsG family protein [Bacilli bacterium]|jgi:hypothetical protein|nr:EpsG family protein [Bacilli bacterium]
MIIYILTFILFITLYFILKKYKNGNKIFCTICTIVLILIVGLRNEKLGLTDTLYVYKPHFLQIYHYDFSFIFELKDYGFQIMTYLFTRIFGDNFQLYLFLFGMPYIICISFLIYKFSKNSLISFICFMSLHYFEISFTLMRQVNAMALLALALYFLINKKYFKFIIFVALAYFFHQISIVFLILLPLSFIPLKKKVIAPIVFAICLAFIMMPFTIRDVLFKLVADSERWQSYEVSTTSKNLVLFAINLLFWIISYLYLDDLKKSNANKVLFLCSTLALCISPLTIILGEFSRVSYLFGIANVVLFPNSLEIFKIKKEKMIISTAAIVVFIIYFLFFLGPDANVVPYEFFF